MGNPSTNIVKTNWNEWSDTWYRRYRTEEAITKLIHVPESAFHPVTFTMLNRALPDLRGKRVCVPSSGDNHAVFAFHLLGADVTSCDISERQLENSSQIARKHGWNIRFLCEDTMQLKGISSGEYDLVYTSNGVHVWIQDLPAMYTNMHRVLKQGGSYIMYDIHPFLRPFGIQAREELQIVKPYDETGPFGEVTTYKWRIQDIMNAMVSSGLQLVHMEEMYAVDGTFWIDESTEEGETYDAEALEQLCDWTKNPSAALPHWLSMHGMKR
ncbi:class I SAM-dependent methyltransferase [Paenibacillus sp. R14(2021)]|uniref:class I SAM-dependent methyltransferase n=1 Tax=Paenibacillus sp. R14(2021) TaxID=2859228 RepID=UPI001C613501|nr:class I SAM-dependent methyltransferase [Paenibacillus sp. R14(2021)]